MRYQLENEQIRIEVDAFGAELKSLWGKAQKQEYLWHGDPKYWGRTSPILFPFVGSLKDKAYTYQGMSYPMGQHGFARDMEFELVEKQEDEIWFQVKDTEETYARYPFRFVLQIGYRLQGNEVTVLWRVHNPAEEPLYFSIGAHPAFLCPIHGEQDKSGYRIFFRGLSKVHHYGNDGTTGLALTQEDNVLLLEQEQAVITSDFFDRCTYIVDHHQTTEVGLVDPEGRRYISVQFDMPLFALWSPEGKNAPFVCIEPWMGRCDAADFSGSLKEREHGNVLAPLETFEAEYRIIVE